MWMGHLMLQFLMIFLVFKPIHQATVPTDDFTVYKIQVELNDITHDTVFLL